MSRKMKYALAGVVIIAVAVIIDDRGFRQLSDWVGLLGAVVGIGGVVFAEEK